MFTKRNALLLMLVLAMILSSGSGIFADQKDISITYNGEPMYFDVSPVIESGRVLVPFAHLFRTLGAEVDWNPEDRTVRGNIEGISIHLKIDSQEAIVNEETVWMDVPARIINNRTMVPLRFASENMGATVEWVEESRTVIIESKEATYEPSHIEFEDVRIDHEETSQEVKAWYEAHKKTAGFHSFQEEEWIYVIAASGERPTGGYTMNVLTVTKTAPAEIFVEAELETPSPDDMVIQVLTYPHSLIRFQETDSVTIEGELRELRSGMQEVTLYFMEETETAFLLAEETRVISKSEATPEGMMQLLMKGPEAENASRIIPENVELKNVSTSEGVAYVDLSSEILEAHYGAEAEGVLVNSIVKTLLQLAEVDAVQILVEGEVIESIAGHMSIDQPIGLEELH